MIDYERFKKAHEMLMNATSLIESDFFVHDIEDLCGAIQRKLEELTKPQPKYAVGDIVWRMNDEDGVTECRVLKNDLASHGQYQCREDEHEAAWWTEEQLYPTRESLIQAQISHWKSMIEEPASLTGEGTKICARPDGDTKKPEECEHEPDGDYILSDDPNDNFPTWECKKCGEFYA